MLMAMLQAGLGVGVTEFHLVWVFERESDLANFVNNGFELGADLNLQVNPGTGGGLFNGAVEVQPGVWLYQISDAGLALDLTVEGTKYFKDPEPELTGGSSPGQVPGTALPCGKFSARTCCLSARRSSSATGSSSAARRGRSARAASRGSRCALPRTRGCPRAARG